MRWGRTEQSRMKDLNTFINEVQASVPAAQPDSDEESHTDESGGGRTPGSDDEDDDDDDDIPSMPAQRHRLAAHTSPEKVLPQVPMFAETSPAAKLRRGTSSAAIGNALPDNDKDKDTDKENVKDKQL